MKCLKSSKRFKRLGNWTYPDLPINSNYPLLCATSSAFEVIEVSFFKTFQQNCPIILKSRLVINLNLIGVSIIVSPAQMWVLVCVCKLDEVRVVV